MNFISRWNISTKTSLEVLQEKFCNLQVDDGEINEAGFGII